MNCIHCPYPALYYAGDPLSPNGKQGICGSCLRRYTRREQEAAELIPLCEGVDEDGEPCPERPGERLCAYCREEAEVAT